MNRRFVSIWFRYLTTDWFTIRQPRLRDMPFVLRAPSHGRMLVTSANEHARMAGVHVGMVVADARAIVPNLEVLDDKPELTRKLLELLAGWCIRFSPMVAIDPPEGILIDATGCSHLWGGDPQYLSDMVRKLSFRKYDVRAAIADTIGAAWAVARYGKPPFVVANGLHIEALLSLPPDALRLEPDVIERLQKLGLHKISQFITISRSSLRRRFGQQFITRLDMAMGKHLELIQPVNPVIPYQERLPCLEPIVTASGIQIALDELLKTLCLRLQQEQKGLRAASFKGYRVDGKIEKIEIGTNRPSHDVNHLFKLFEIKLPTIEPALGIELFTLEASIVDDHYPHQEQMWEGSQSGLEDIRLSELLDRLAGKVGIESVRRYVPDEHYWPERSLRRAACLNEKLPAAWRMDKPRPLQLLPVPQRIDVTAPIPDYPPMLFRHNGKLHKIIKADGPERIEQEWWLQQGQHRDYYQVEDEEGHRFWLFRLGHYEDKTYQWFLHGFFA